METASFRIETWKSGLQMLARRPLLGWGAGNFAREYPPFRSEAEFRLSHKYVQEGFVEVEDPHSSGVAAAVETGVPGLLAFLLVVYVAARLWRYYVCSAQDPDTAAALAGLGGGAAAYLVAGLFNTLTLHVSHTVLFWCFLALIEVLGDKRPWRQGSRVREARVALPAAAAIVAAFGAFWTLRVGMAEASFNEGMSSADASIRETRLREAVDAHPQSWRAHYELARTLMALRRYPGAAAVGKMTLRLRPHHVEALNLTAVSLSLGVGNDAEAQALLQHAIEVAPYYFKSYYNLGVFRGRRDRVTEARASFTESIRHNPAHALSYYYRGATFLAGGEAAGAIEDFRKARSLGFDVAAALRSEQPSVMNDGRFSEFFR
jgi:tetratricopeptide (TPR) repeat protein